MITAIYIRTSTEDQNPENQIKDCEALNRWGSYELYRDQQSAWKEDKERPDFEELKKQIKKSKINHLIVWDFDRIYRNRSRFKAFLELLKVYNVQLHSYRQKWIEDIHKIPPPWNEIVSDLMINIYGHIAEDESTQKSKRVKAAIRIKEDGVYSYKGNKWGRKQLSTFKKNQLLKLRKDGLSMNNIAKELGISKGAVHKYLTLLSTENKDNSRMVTVSQ